MGQPVAVAWLLENTDGLHTGGLVETGPDFVGSSQCLRETYVAAFGQIDLAMFCQPLILGKHV